MPCDQCVLVRMALGSVLVWVNVNQQKDLYRQVNEYELLMVDYNGWLWMWMGKWMRMRDQVEVGRKEIGLVLIKSEKSWKKS